MKRFDRDPTYPLILATVSVALALMGEHKVKKWEQMPDRDEWGYQIDDDVDAMLTKAEPLLRMLHAPATTRITLAWCPQCHDVFLVSAKAKTRSCLAPRPCSGEVITAIPALVLE